MAAPTRSCLLQTCARNELESACRRLEPCYAVPDGQVANLILNMCDEVRSGCNGGRLYAEALSIALATYLLGRYAGQADAMAQRRPTLSRAQVSRVRDYIEANLARDLGIVELAELVGLSPHHFSALFKCAFGVSPHRYLLMRRVDEARRLLLTEPGPIAQLALNLGFSDQSHFSQVFRRFTGTTPSRFRETC